jgi:hypothetical protein
VGDPEAWIQNPDADYDGKDDPFINFLYPPNCNHKKDTNPNNNNIINPNHNRYYCKDIMKPKIGKFRVPKVRLKILLGELYELFKKFGDKAFTISEFGNTLGISESSSGLLQKKQELKTLGLLWGDDTSLKITDSGKKSVQQNIPERQKEIESVVKRIGLWDELLKSGKNIDDSRLFEILQNKTGLDEVMLKGRFKEIKWAFTEDVNCITQFDPYSIKKAERYNPKIALQQIPHKIIPQIESPHIIPIIKENKHLITNAIMWKISSDFGEFQTEISDDLSLSNARSITIQLLDTIERKIMAHKNTMKKTNTHN